MTLLVDTRNVRPEDRADALHDVVARTLVRSDMEYPAGGADARGAITPLGDLTLATMRSNTQKVTRTPHQAKEDAPPSVIVALQLEGSSLVAQSDREVQLHPGELVMWDTTQPFTLTDELGIRQHLLRISLPALALPHNAIRASTAAVLSPGSTIAGLTTSFFARMAREMEVQSGPSAELLAAPSIELVRALIATHLREESSAAESQQETLTLRILEFVRDHLRDPDLSASDIAHEHHISERQLYYVLAASGITLSDWIRDRRLRGARVQLQARAARRMSVAEVAAAWGFRNSSSFTRLFRSTYGVTPSEWRASARSRPDEP